MRRDGTDFLTWAALAFLSAALVFLLLVRDTGTPSGGREAMKVFPSADLEETALAGYLGHYPPAPADRGPLNDFLAGNPDNALAHMESGLLFWREGKLDAAATSIRRALELNRSFADVRSPLYRGEILKKVVEEGLRVYLRERMLRPEDQGVRKAVKDFYFIQRSMAGGCD